VSPQVAVNAAVALAWRLPLLQGLMARNFTHLPGSGRCRTLLTSVFSHRGALHLTVSA
jgi:rhomboid-like protein